MFVLALHSGSQTFQTLTGSGRTRNLTENTQCGDFCGDHISKRRAVLLISENLVPEHISALSPTRLFIARDSRDSRDSPVNIGPRASRVDFRKSGRSGRSRPKLPDRARVSTLETGVGRSQSNQTLHRRKARSGFGRNLRKRESPKGNSRYELPARWRYRPRRTDCLDF